MFYKVIKVIGKKPDNWIKLIKTQRIGLVYSTDTTFVNAKGPCCHCNLIYI